MINVVKLVSDKGDFVYVNNDVADIQYVHFTGLGFVLESDKKVEATKTEPTQTEPENDPKTADVNLDAEGLLKLSKADLLKLAAANEIKVSESVSKPDIVKQLLAKV